MDKECSHLMVQLRSQEGPSHTPEPYYTNGSEGLGCEGSNPVVSDLG